MYVGLKKLVAEGMVEPDWAIKTVGYLESP
jgi:hypothetical protein